MEWDRSSGEKVPDGDSHRQLSHHRHKSSCGFENWLRILFGLAIVTLLFHSILPSFHYNFNLFTVVEDDHNNYITLHSDPSSFTSPDKKRVNLKNILNGAAMKDGKTVIITTLNEAWAAPNSVFDIFLESFKIGYDVEKLLNHLVVVALDYKAYSRCLVMHAHCYALNSGQWDVDDVSSSEAYFMTPNYLEMMWKRIDFLRQVLELGFNFIFTDADIMWFRDPFPKFHLDVDFHIACDYFTGDPWDLSNLPNGGFAYVKSNERTIEFYRYWYDSRMTYPGLHDQEVLDKIKDNVSLLMGVKIMFLDTTLFGGFCETSKDFNQVCTMHANCCFGLDNKVHDLRILLDDWRNYLLRSNDLDDQSSSDPPSWNAPQNCSIYHYQPPDLPKKNQTLGKENGSDVGLGV